MPLILEAGDGSAYTLPVVLDLSAFTLESGSIDVPWASPMPGVLVPPFSLSNELRDLVIEAVRPLAQKYLRISVPVAFLDDMQLRLLMQTVVVPRIRPTAIVVEDDCLAVGFDIFQGTEPVMNGDPNAITEPWQAWADTSICSAARWITTPARSSSSSAK